MYTKILRKEQQNQIMSLTVYPASFQLKPEPLYEFSFYPKTYTHTHIMYIIYNGK